MQADDLKGAVVEMFSERDTNRLMSQSIVFSHRLRGVFEVFTTMRALDLKANVRIIETFCYSLLVLKHDA